MRLRSCIPPITTLLLLPSAIAAQQWVPLYDLPAGKNSTQPTYPTAAYDPSRERAVIAVPGIAPGSDLWEWNGRWLRRDGAARPPFIHAALVTDTVHQRVLAIAPSSSPGVFAYDGIRWQPLGAAFSPIPYGATLAFDSVRDEVLSCGSSVFPPPAALEMWSWQNGVWAQRMPTGNWPAARNFAALAFDPARGRAVLFGGQNPSNFLQLGDTWEWDGTAWTQFAGTGPSPRSISGMAFDSLSQSIVLFGGSGTQNTPLDETWSFDGTQWLQVPATLRPTARVDPNLVTTPAGVMMVGGSLFGDTWLLVHNTWIPLQPELNPPGRIAAVMAYDPVRAETVLHGGISDDFSGFLRDDTWTFDGSWQQRQPTSSPPWRMLADMVFDRARSEMVLFGGIAFPAPLADTWTWNGSNWALRSPTNSPPGRRSHRLAYDQLRQRVVLFGGHDGTTELGDTWLWDGSNWTQATPAASPPARASHLMAFDAARGVTVMTAGSGTTAFSDTWLWDGTTWLPTAATAAPVSAGDCEFDAQRGRILAFDSSSEWSWNGTDWVQAPIAATASFGSSGSSLAFDEQRQRMLQFGGDPNGGVDWLLAYTPTPAATADYGSGCAPGTTPHPELFAIGRPAIREVNFAIGVRADTSGRPMLLAVGLASQQIAIGGGCDLLVDQLGVLRFLLSGNNGFVAVPLPIPDVPSLRGLAIYGQAGVLLPSGLAFSRGLRLTVGD